MRPLCGQQRFRKKSRSERTAILIAAIVFGVPVAASLPARASSLTEASSRFTGPVGAVTKTRKYPRLQLLRSALATVALPNGWRPVFLGRHLPGAYPDHFALRATLHGRVCSLQATLINQPVLTTGLPQVHLGGISDNTPAGPLGRAFNIAETRHRSGSIRVRTRIGVRTEGGEFWISPFGAGSGVPSDRTHAHRLGLAVFHAPRFPGAPASDRWAHAFIDIAWADASPTTCHTWAARQSLAAARTALRTIVVTRK
jgi:hypothetical protein